MKSNKFSITGLSFASFLDLNHRVNIYYSCGLPLRLEHLTHFLCKPGSSKRLLYKLDLFMGYPF